MQFIAIPTEQTTALTDALLGLEALLLAGYLGRFVSLQPLRTRYWQFLLLLTALASFLGTIAHGIVMSEATYLALWKPLLLILGLIVANVVLVAVYDLFGAQAAQKVRLPLLAMAIGFFAITFFPWASFLLFIIYEGIGMLFGLFCYAWLARHRRLAGAGMIATGIVLQLVAATVQATGPYEVVLIWPFDHNGLFHIIGMIATFIMVVGAAKGFHPTTGKKI